ncbi:hypothetical protein HK100_012049 [Physocladia obscura]|uniref:Metallo-beta-lactamase domain-containing protein n=1 Tax=Physocladia obscura TaxID=109957 RepID=A0AAD5T0B7_9FUNG|nr:hypothetical protein HK100_012049 [Physocladia obscura]
MTSETQTVVVRIIDSTASIEIPVDRFLQPKIAEHSHLKCPAFSFLIEHRSGKKVLFDLGVKKEWRQLAPVVAQRLEAFDWIRDVQYEVGEILEHHGVTKSSIDAIIWSHWHWDHTGNTELFPPTTSLIVGPGFTAAFCPGFPASPTSPVREVDYAGRSFVELPLSAFNTTVSFTSFGDGEIIIANETDGSNGAHGASVSFTAHDYFEDGSFFLLHAPGHAIGHLCALARTTKDSFIFLGADAAHHVAQFRPSPQIPLPDNVSIPIDSNNHFVTCPGSFFEDLHPSHSRTKPFYAIQTNSTSVANDPIEAQKTLDKLEHIDGLKKKVLIVLAHDASIKNVLDFFPLSANNWLEKGWAIDAHWRFLADFVKK